MAIRYSSRLRQPPPGSRWTHLGHRLRGVGGDRVRAPPSCPGGDVREAPATGGCGRPRSRTRRGRVRLRTWPGRLPVEGDRGVRASGGGGRPATGIECRGANSNFGEAAE